MSGILTVLEYMTKSKISQLFDCVISKQLVLLCFFLASFNEILLEVLPKEIKKARV